MDWQIARIVVRAEDADNLGDALLAAGALSVEAADADADTPDEAPIFAEPGADAGVWNRTSLSALFPAEADTAALVEEACRAAGLKSAAMVVDRVPEQDWVRMTQSQFEPIRISARLWIVPTWCSPPEPDAVCLRLDPGLAFGTGSHPTTRLCLRWLDAHLKPCESVLDYGCGSGILAIAAARLGGGAVAGVDVDPQAVRASRDNAASNEVSASFFGPDDFPGGSFDIVVANILANPLRVLAPLLSNLCRPGGRIVLSGILSHQEEWVRESYAPWISFGQPLEEDGWVCLSGERTVPAPG